MLDFSTRIIGQQNLYEHLPRRAKNRNKNDLWNFSFSELFILIGHQSVLYNFQLVIIKLRKAAMQSLNTKHTKSRLKLYILHIHILSGLITFFFISAFWYTCKFCKKFPAVISFKDSCHDGIMQFFSRSSLVAFTFLWNSSNTQSMIRMIRWGGRPSVRTVAMSAGLIVYIIERMDRIRNYHSIF